MGKYTPLILALAVACTPSDEPSGSTGPSSSGLETDYGLFMADGIINPLDPNFAPLIPADFFVEHFDYSEAEIEQERTAAKAFFADAYGLDVDALSAEGRAQFIEYRIDPGANYRVRALPDRVVQPEGWPVDDLAFSLAIIDPSGVELGGAYAGAVAAPGALAVSGYYVFDALDEEGAFDETVVIRYHSDGVAATSLDGRSLFFCAMESEQLGTGLGKITSSIVQLDDGRIANDFTNVQSWDQ